MSTEVGLEAKGLYGSDGPGSLYKPPPQFKEIDTPPLLPVSLPDNAELWLVRIQDNQLKPDEFNGKRVALALNALDGRMGCFENSKGSPFEIVDLHNVSGVQPFAFLPKGDSSLEGDPLRVEMLCSSFRCRKLVIAVRRVSRQVAIVRSLDPVTLSTPCSNMDQHLPSEPDGKINVRSSHKQKQTLSIHEGVSLRGAGDQIKEEEGHGVSASLSMGVGGFSTVESLQDDEERISTGKLGKSSKKSKRDQPTLNSEVELSPLGFSGKDLEVQEEQASSKKKSRKHKKIKQEQSG